MTFTTRVTFGVLFSMLATAAFGQTTYFYLHPGDIQTLTGCLYQNGHRVQIYGVKIDWSGGSTEYVGGHNHPDPRPITSFNTTIYEDTLQTTTDSTGCSSVQTRASWYSGEYWIYANPEGPILASRQHTNCSFPIWGHHFSPTATSSARLTPPTTRILTGATQLCLMTCTTLQTNSTPGESLLCSSFALEITRADSWTPSVIGCLTRAWPRCTRTRKNLT